MWHWRLLLLAAGAVTAAGAAAALAPQPSLFVQLHQPLGSTTLNVSCASNDTCSTYNTRSTCVLTNVTAGTKQCSCALPVYPYPDWKNDICQQWPGGAGDPCISALDCWRDTVLFCNDTAGPETGLCACPTERPNFFGDMCYLDITDYDSGTCADTPQCQAAFGEHTTCGAAVNVTGNVCRCKDSAVFVADACWLQRDLHEPCVETHECGAAFSECVEGECRCQAGWTERVEPRTQQAVCVGAAAAAAAAPLLTLAALVAALRGM